MGNVELGGRGERKAHVLTSVVIYSRKGMPEIKKAEAKNWICQEKARVYGLNVMKGYKC